MKTERREDTAAMLDALQPLIGEKSTTVATTGPSRVSRTPIIPAAPAGRSTPGPTPSLPRVILPDDSGGPGGGELHPHRHAERIVYVLGALLLLTSLILWMIHEPPVLSDGRTSTLPAPVSAAPVEEPSEIARLEISGRLPSNAVITANGRTLTERAMALAPGRYVLTASAPGFASASDTLTISANRTVVWSPQLAHTARDRVAARRAELPRVSERAP